MPGPHRLSSRLAGSILASSFLFALAFAAPASAQSSRIQELLDKARAGDEGSTITSSEALDKAFTVNAQYRRGLRKGYRGIGEGKVRFVPEGGNKFTVVTNANIRHPEEKGTVYDWSMDMQFMVDGNRVYPMKKDNRFNHHSQEYSDNIEKTVPFVYLSKYTPVPEGKGEREETWYVGAVEYKMLYRTIGKSYQAELYEGKEQIAKFFLHRGDSVPYEMEKLRFTTALGTVISFVLE